MVQPSFVKCRRRGSSSAEGYEAAGPILQQAIAAARTSDDLRIFPIAALVADSLWDDDARYALSACCVELCRKQGALTALPLALALLVGAEFYAARLNAARALAAEQACRTWTTVVGQEGIEVEGQRVGDLAHELAVNDVDEAHKRESPVTLLDELARVQRGVRSERDGLRDSKWPEQTRPTADVRPRPGPSRSSRGGQFVLIGREENQGRITHPDDLRHLHLTEPAG
jgi:hypothetical protein